MKNYPLSETETGIVAEYMASILLKYDKSYSPSLLSYQEVKETSDVVSEEDDTVETTKEPKYSEEDRIDDKSDTKDIDYTLSEIIGESSFDIQYIGYKLVDTYPEDETNRVFSIDPREGYRLLVVDFTVENISDKDNIFDLTEAKIKYHLDINKEAKYRPQLALLENNLQHINMNIKTGGLIPAVLIFEIPSDMDESEINLIVTKDTKTKTIKIK